MPQAAGVFKRLTYKAETTYGVAPSASGAQALRRTSSDLNLVKDAYQSAEIRGDHQLQDMRHGVRRVEGTIAGELSPGTYDDWLDVALRRDRTTVSALTGLSITVAGAGPTYTLTRAAGDFLTGGVKRGDVVRLTAGSFAAGNLNKNLLVTNVTATVLTVRVLNGSALTAEGPVASATLSWPGKKTWMPTSGHTNKSFSVEHWFADVAQSELFTGVQPTQIDLQLPPTGMATISIGTVGRDMTTATAQYFTNPTAETTTGVAAAVTGLVLIGGTAVAALTGLSLSIQSPRTGDPVVGSNTIPSRVPGRLVVTGEATAYFEDATFRNVFVDETTVELIFVFASDNAANADFISFVMPRAKINGSTKNDGEEGINQTLPFQALLPPTGGSGIANELTTLSIQDSAG
jgi:hypothetical protein